MFLSYVLSFVYHRHLLEQPPPPAPRPRTSDGRVLWANLHLLFWLSLFPFATAWMGENAFRPGADCDLRRALLMAALAYYRAPVRTSRRPGQPSALRDAIGRDLKGKVSVFGHLAGFRSRFVAPLVGAAIYVAVVALTGSFRTAGWSARSGARSRSRERMLRFLARVRARKAVMSTDPGPLRVSGRRHRPTFVGAAAGIRPVAGRLPVAGRRVGLAGLMPTIDRQPPDPATFPRDAPDATAREVTRSEPTPGPATLAEIFRAISLVATPMMVTDLSARIEFVNAAAADLFGRDAAALRGRSVELILPMDFVPRVPVLIDLIRLKGRLDGSFPALRADGTSLLIDVSVEIATTVPDGRQWLVTTMRDLSDQVRTIEQLSASALGLAGQDEESLLLETIRSARRLIGTRYVALGVVEDGRITRFITRISPEQVQAIGREPEGHGLLGAMMAEDQSLRLAEISSDPRSIGFPDGHPPMHSFLGTRIHVDDETYGQLYLTEKIGAPEFSVLDERLAELFAAHAAIAIRHLRQTRRSRHPSQPSAATRSGWPRHSGSPASVTGNGTSSPIW